MKRPQRIHLVHPFLGEELRNLNKAKFILDIEFEDCGEASWSFRMERSLTYGRQILNPEKTIWTSFSHTL